MAIDLRRPRKPIYFDYAAATPAAKEVQAAMRPLWSRDFGNPSSLHRLGRAANLALEKARQKVANLINAQVSEIIFTAGGTESVNLAIFGVSRNYPRGHIIASAIEHDAVLNAFKALAGEGRKTTFIPVDKEGLVSLEKLKQAITPRTVLLSLGYANNEIGTIQPIAQIGKLLKNLNVQRLAQGLPAIIFHTDACQAAGFLSLDVKSLGVDLLSVNGSKIYGPKQSGFLYVRQGINLKPLIYGGGQEKGLRSGTENVAGVVGLAKALEVSQKNKIRENHRLLGLRDYFIKQLLRKIPQATLNGPLLLNYQDHRLPNNINITVRGVEGEALMLYLDAHGIYVSTGSACSAGQVANPSHVLLAIGKSKEEALSSIRMTLGKQNSKQDLVYAIKIIVQLVKKLRELIQQAGWYTF